MFKSWMACQKRVKRTRFLAEQR